MRCGPENPPDVFFPCSSVCLSARRCRHPENLKEVREGGGAVYCVYACTEDGGGGYEKNLLRPQPGLARSRDRGGFVFFAPPPPSPRLRRGIGERAIPSLNRQRSNDTVALGYGRIRVPPVARSAPSKQERPKGLAVRPQNRPSRPDSRSLPPPSSEIRHRRPIPERRSAPTPPYRSLGR